MSRPIVSNPTLIKARGERCRSCHIPIVRGVAIHAPLHERPGLYHVDCWDRQVKEEQEQHESGAAGAC